MRMSRRDGLWRQYSSVPRMWIYWQRKHILRIARLLLLWRSRHKCLLWQSNLSSCRSVLPKALWSLNYSYRRALIVLSKTLMRAKIIIHECNEGWACSTKRDCIKKGKPYRRLSFQTFAEDEGFKPPIPGKGYTGFRVQRIRSLCQSSLRLQLQR